VIKLVLNIIVLAGAYFYIQPFNLDQLYKIFVFAAVLCLAFNLINIMNKHKKSN
jgi:uncharacterized membrane protein YwzB